MKELLWRLRLSYYLTRTYCKPWQIVKAWKLTGVYCWYEYYKDGYSPREAIIEDMGYGRDE